MTTVTDIFGTLTTAVTPPASRDLLAVIAESLETA